MKWLVLILLGIAIIILIVFLVRRNLKDMHDFKSYLENNYQKKKDVEGDIETDEIMK